MNTIFKSLKTLVHYVWNIFKKYSVVYGLGTLVTASQIPSPKFLNNRTVQAARITFARKALDLRRQKQPETTESDALLKSHLEHLNKFGYTFVPEFLSPDCLKEIRACRDIELYTPQLFKQFSLRGAEYIDARLDEVMPITEKFLRNHTLTAKLPLQYLCKTKLRKNWRFKCVRDLEMERDANCSNHSDTFHNTLKMWVYLDDVSKSEDCLKFWKSSHLAHEQLDELRLQEILKGNGSPRIPNAVLRQLNFELLDVDIAFNTLVIADTHGFHYRNFAPQKYQWRKSLFCSLRANPFFS